MAPRGPSIDAVLLWAVSLIALGLTWHFGIDSLASIRWVFNAPEDVSLIAHLTSSDFWFSLSGVAYAYLIFAFCYALYWLRGFLFTPMDYSNMVIDPITGTDSSKGREKFLGQPPPPYPQGWFRVLDTIDVPNAGDMQKVSRMGKEMLVFRGLSGKVFAVEPACPNSRESLLNAKIEEGDVLVSPSGAWRYAAETGSCSPSSGQDLLTYQLVEANGEIYHYNSLDNQPPSWFPAAPPEMNGRFVYHGRSEHIITAHICEIPENGADAAHLGFLHSDLIVSTLQPLLSHYWTVDWHQGDPTKDEQEEKHCAYVHITQALKVFNKWILPGSLLDVRVTQYGLGLVYLHFQTPLGVVYVIESVTPVAPICQLYHHIIWAEWQIPRPIGKGILRGLCIQAERDVSIWNYKAYLNKPMIVKGDGPIREFRRWYKQFYLMDRPRPATGAVDDDNAGIAAN